MNIDADHSAVVTEIDAADSLTSDMTPLRNRRSFVWRSFVWRWSRRALKTTALLIGFYLAAVVVGLIPVNRGFVPDEKGVEIFIFSGTIHSDIILPITNELVDWRSEIDFPGFTPTDAWASHLCFGWGDRGFYVDTPTWNDLKVSTALRALAVPSQTVMHVSPSMQPLPGGNCRSVKISPDQYRSLCAFINDSFAHDERGELRLIDNAAYGQSDAFFVANGYYHCFRTCNCWVGDALQTSGIKTGWFTPLPKTVFLYLP